MSLKKIVIFASGSGSSAENIFQKFGDSSGIDVVKLYCNNPNAYVLKRFEKHEIDKMIFNKSELDSGKVLEDLININPELIVLAGFLKKIPKKIIDVFRSKIINIHPALLPRYGGKGMYGFNVHKKVIENKDNYSGFTIHYVNENYDEGDIIFQKKIKIKSYNAQDLAKEILKSEHDYYPKIIFNLLNE